jgi:hypothetical protein
MYMLVIGLTFLDRKFADLKQHKLQLTPLPTVHSISLVVAAILTSLF